MSGSVVVGSWADITGSVRALTSATGIAFGSLIAGSTLLIAAEEDPPATVQENFYADGPVHVLAGRDILSYYLTSVKDQIVADAGGSIQLAETASAAKNLWMSARDGSISGTLTSSEGWVYVWAKEDVGGSITAQQTASVTAWNDLDADVASDDGVEAFVGGDSFGKIRGKSWVDLETRGNLFGSVTAGDLVTAGAITIRSGGNIIGKIESTGSADVAASGDIKTDVTADEDWLSVVADGDIEGEMFAGAEAEVWAGGKVSGSIKAGLDASIRELETERGLHLFGIPKNFDRLAEKLSPDKLDEAAQGIEKTDLKKVPADRIRSMLADGLAKEYQGAALST